jgi:hypothetical protein
MPPAPDASGEIAVDPPPSTPPLFLAVRFLLELCGLAGWGFLGWWLGEGGWLGGMLAGVSVIAGAALWGVFRVRHDPPGKTDHPVIVPGPVRFAVEIGFFAVAAGGLWFGAGRAASETLMTAVVLLYGITWDRQRWLLRQ